MNGKADPEISVQDEAARAGWLYYVGGMTQDQIAQSLGVSRQRAQRLVSRAVAEGLVHVRLQHRIVSSLELERELINRFSLRQCRVGLSLPDTHDQTPSIAPIAASEIERVLRRDEPLVIALGTGRTMRASVEEMKPMVCEHHRLVSLNGTIGHEGAAASHDAIMRIADLVQAPVYPMAVPVICESVEEREAFHSLAPVRKVAEYAAGADVTFVGLGQMTEDAPIFKDGYLSATEMDALRRDDAAGEIAGWVFDSTGRYIQHGASARTGGVRVEPDSAKDVIGIAAGPSKVTALRAALKGRLINGLITDEITARALLAV